MSASTTPRFDIPNELRAVAERSIVQAKAAFDTYMSATHESFLTLQTQVTESHSCSYYNTRKKAIRFAERNVHSAFDFARRIVQANDFDEFMRMLTEFIQSQVHVLTEQASRLNDTSPEIAIFSVTPLSRQASPQTVPSLWTQSCRAMLH